MPPKKRPQQRASSSAAKQGTEALARLLTLPEKPKVLEPPYLPPLEAEWLEPDGCGGFASGTVAGIRTRRTHALLLVATSAPGGQVVLVNGLDARLTTRRGLYELSSHRYGPDVVHPDGMRRIESFQPFPWPTWVYRLDDGTRIEHELFAVNGAPGVILTWSVVDGAPQGLHLSVRPLLSGREAGALHHENGAIRMDAMSCDTSVRWQPYQGVPPILAGSNGSYSHHPLWYRNFLYAEDRALGLDHMEDLASPGAFLFDLARGDALLVLTTDEGLETMKSAALSRAAGLPGFVGATTGDPEGALSALRDTERAHRQSFHSRLHRAADAYTFRREDRVGMAPGYPRAEECTRDVLIALRGCCLATGRLDEARQILLGLAATVSEGMLPHYLPGPGQPARYDSVDASLWYVIVVHEYFRAAQAARRRVAAADRSALEGAVRAIVDGYSEGTRHGIHMDHDGLLAVGERGRGVTWMDDRRGDEEISPRIGKPVEIQALWLNTLRALPPSFGTRWSEAYERGREVFQRKFWNEGAGGLNDVVDADHVHGAIDATIRPNQIFAVGGLPASLIDGERAKKIVETVTAKLLTPLGLRTLAPDDPGYAPRYEGNVYERLALRHQGLVWPWLMGPFVEAWVRVRGDTPEVKAEARERFLAPLLAQLQEAGLGHISELANGDPPHVPGGSAFYAPSLGEALRLDQVVLRES